MLRFAALSHLSFSLAVAESPGTLDETLAVLSRQLEEAALRAMRLLMIAVVALIVVLLLVKIVFSLLGAVSVR